MKAFRWKYPGDPEDICIHMNRLEFLGNFPREPIKIISGGAVLEEIPMGDNEIHCDFCNEDPLDDIFVINSGSKALCKKCAEESVIPHITGKGS